ncbi:unnamed protein product, partial [Ectocarpus sp. 12 AP-2014]
CHQVSPPSCCVWSKITFLANQPIRQKETQRMRYKVQASPYTICEANIKTAKDGTPTKPQNEKKYLVNGRQKCCIRADADLDQIERTSTRKISNDTNFNNISITSVTIREGAHHT